MALVALELLGATPNERAVIEAVQYSYKLAEKRLYHPGVAAIKAVQARDSRILLWLEKAVSILDAMHERERGEERRSARDNRMAESGEYSAWKAAFKVAQDYKAEQGSEALQPFIFIFGAVAVFSCITPRPNL